MVCYIYSKNVNKCFNVTKKSISSTPSHYHNNFTYSLNRKWKRSRRMMQVSAANHLITEPLPLLDKPLNTSHWSGYIHLDGHDNLLEILDNHV